MDETSGPTDHYPIKKAKALPKEGDNDEQN